MNFKVSVFKSKEDELLDKFLPDAGVSTSF